MRIPKIFCPILKHIGENKLFWSSMTWFILKNGEIMPYFKSQKPFRLLHLRVLSKLDFKFQVWPKIHINLNKACLDDQKYCYIVNLILQSKSNLSYETVVNQKMIKTQKRIQFKYEKTVPKVFFGIYGIVASSNVCY